MSALVQTIYVILRKRQLCQRIGLSLAQIYAMLDPKSKSHDPSFPRQIRLGASHRSTAVGWLEHEVQTWLEARVHSSRGECEASTAKGASSKNAARKSPTIEKLLATITDIERGGQKKIEARAE